MNRHLPHHLPVALFFTAGLAMIVVGSLRLGLRNYAPASQFSSRTILNFYSLLIVFGLAFVVLATRLGYFHP